MKTCFKMSYRRKMLLAAVIFTALCYKVTAEKKLDMAPQAVDYLYDGCDEQVLDTVINSVLKQELNRSEEFKTAWGSSSCSQLVPGGVEEHTTALMAYAQGSDAFLKTFNDAVATKGGNLSTYENSFHFKSLHFLLMDAMSLKNKEVKCQHLYFQTETVYKATKDSKVRFGSFKKVTTSKISEDLDEGTSFEIYSCFFFNLENFCDVEEDLALISPAEEFKVLNVERKHGDNYDTIHLNHSKLARPHNCHIISRSPADVSTQWLVLVLLGFSLFFFNC